MSETQPDEYTKVAKEEGVNLDLNTQHAFGTRTSFHIAKDGAHAFIDVTKIKNPEQLRSYIRYLFST